MLSRRCSHVAVLGITILFLILLLEQQLPTFKFTKKSGISAKRLIPSTSSRAESYNRAKFLTKRAPAIQPQECSDVSLPENVTKSVQKFLFFVGHGRSGHSIIGSILDAHPHIVISHEYSLFHEWTTMSKQDMNRGYLYSAIYNNSCYNSINGLRRVGATKKGYTLHIPGLWQGRYDGDIAVIGDKSGGMTTKLFQNQKESVKQAFKEIKQAVGVPIVVLHAIRNPFDNIATMLLYKKHARKAATSQEPYTNIKELKKQVTLYFRQVRSVMKMIKQLKLDVIEVHNSDLIHRPNGAIRRLCNRLQVKCSKDYVSRCSKAVFKDISRSRLKVKWTPKLIETVEKKSKKFQFLKKYSFL
uniref:Protein-tyrosine sulfotransferase n=1 Tax=Amphimedon queenslandica TaxID=400682 RepID=A0A1X7VPR0_AMPQE